MRKFASMLALCPHTARLDSSHELQANARQFQNTDKPSQGRGPGGGNVANDLGAPVFAVGALRTRSHLGPGASGLPRRQSPTTGSLPVPHLWGIASPTSVASAPPLGHCQCSTSGSSPAPQPHHRSGLGGDVMAGGPSKAADERLACQSRVAAVGCRVARCPLGTSSAPARCQRQCPQNRQHLAPKARADLHWLRRHQLGLLDPLTTQ